MCGEGTNLRHHNIWARFLDHFSYPLYSRPALASDPVLAQLHSAASMAQERGSATEEHSTMEDNEDDLLRQALQALLSGDEKIKTMILKFSDLSGPH